MLRCDHLLLILGYVTCTSTAWMALQVGAASAVDMADNNRLSGARQTLSRPSNNTATAPSSVVRETRPQLRGPAMRRHQGRVPGAMSNPQLNRYGSMMLPTMHADPYFAFHLAQQQQQRLLGSSARQVRLMMRRPLIVRTSALIISYQC